MPTARATQQRPTSRQQAQASQAPSQRIPRPKAPSRQRAVPSCLDKAVPTWRGRDESRRSETKEAAPSASQALTATLSARLQGQDAKAGRLLQRQPSATVRGCATLPRLQTLVPGSRARSSSRSCTQQAARISRRGGTRSPHSPEPPQSAVRTRWIVVIVAYQLLTG